MGVDSRVIMPTMQTTLEQAASRKYRLGLHCPRPIRVLALINAYSWGGGEAVLVSKWRHRSKMIEYELCTTYRCGRLGLEAKKLGVPVYELNPFITSGSGSNKVWEGILALTSVWTLVKLVKLIKNQHIEIVHAHGFPASLFGAIASLFTPGVKYIYSHHFVRSVPWARVEEALFRWVFSRYVAIVAVSDDIRTSLLRWFPQIASRCVVIWNGVDLDKFRPAPSIKFRLRAALGLQEDDIVLANVARLVPYKNHKLLISAFSELLRQHPNVRLLLIGEGPLRSELEAMSSELGLSERVVFLGYRSDVADILAASDIFVMPSVAEGLPVAALEAMAVGLPIVASTGHGIRQVVRPNETGILVPPTQAMAWCCALAELVTDSTKRRRMGERGRRVAEAQFDIQATVDRYETLYILASGVTDAVREEDAHA